MDEERVHRAYLVRMWAVHGDGALIWRASIENVHTGEQRAFADLPSLCSFLYEVAAPPAATGKAATAEAQHNEKLSTSGL